MAFQPPPPRRRPKQELVVGVGSRAFVNWSPPSGETRGGVPMTDGSGTVLTNDLSDGQEVEILSWRPRSREGLSYQIRRVSDGREWWIAATFLRRASIATAPAEAQAVAEKRAPA